MFVIKKYFSAINPLTTLLFITLCSFFADTLAAAGAAAATLAIDAAANAPKNFIIAQIKNYWLPLIFVLPSISIAVSSHKYSKALTTGSLTISGFLILIILCIKLFF